MEAELGQGYAATTSCIQLLNGMKILHSVRGMPMDPGIFRRLRYLLVKTLAVMVGVTKFTSNIYISL